MVCFLPNSLNVVLIFEDNDLKKTLLYSREENIYELQIR